MATKLNPGRFDCYAAARPDEEIFCLLERDPIAPFLVSIWAKIRMGDPAAAQVVFEEMCTKLADRYIVEPDVDKALEALDCALAMFRAQQEQHL